MLLPPSQVYLAYTPPHSYTFPSCLGFSLVLDDVFLKDRHLVGTNQGRPLSGKAKLELELEVELEVEVEDVASGSDSVEDLVEVKSGETPGSKFGSVFVFGSSDSFGYRRGARARWPYHISPSSSLSLSCRFELSRPE